MTLTGSDADGHPLVFRIVSPPDRGDFDLTTNVVVEDDEGDGVLIVPEGATLAYTPELNFFGRDTFLFEAEEISGAGLRSILAMVTILVNPRQSFMACVIDELGPGDKCLDTSPEDDVMGASPLDVIVADLNGDLRLDLITANSESGDLSVLLGRGGASFSAPQKFPVSGSPNAVVVADLNGDGIPDLATANRFSNNVSLLIGQSNDASPLNFVVQPGIAVGDSPSDLAVGDFDLNSIPDLVTANADSSNVSVLIGQRDSGVFTIESQQATLVSGPPSAVAVADMNNDGRPDIITANGLASNSVTVLLAQGNGELSFLRFDQGIEMGEEPVSLAVADVNEDGFLDVITANNDSDSVSVLLGQGDGTFGLQRQFPVGREPRHVVVADLDADDNLDLATANAETDNVSVLLGLGDDEGTFLVEQSFGVGDNPSAIAIADVNRDGTLDFVTTEQFSHTVTGLFGHGDGTFPAAQGFGVGARPQAVAADDLDADVRLDLATANASSDDVTVLFRQRNGTFEFERSFALVDDAFGPRDVIIADLENGDAILDMVTANAGIDQNPSTTVSILLGARPDNFTLTTINADSMRQGRWPWATSMAIPCRIWSPRVMERTSHRATGPMCYWPSVKGVFNSCATRPYEWVQAPKTWSSGTSMEMATSIWSPPTPIRTMSRWSSASRMAALIRIA